MKTKVGFLFVAASFCRGDFTARELKSSRFSFIVPRGKIILDVNVSKEKCPACLAQIHEAEHLADGYSIVVKAIDGLTDRSNIHPDIIQQWDQLQAILLQADQEKRIEWREY